MTFKIIINYKDKEKIYKLIQTPLDTKIVVNKAKDEYIISLSDSLNTHLYSFKESEVDSFSIERVV